MSNAQTAQTFNKPTPSSKHKHHTNKTTPLETSTPIERAGSDLEGIGRKGEGEEEWNRRVGR